MTIAGGTNNGVSKTATAECPAGTLMTGERSHVEGAWCRTRVWAAGGWAAGRWHPPVAAARQAAGSLHSAAAGVGRERTTCNSWPSLRLTAPVLVCRLHLLSGFRCHVQGRIRCLYPGCLFCGCQWPLRMHCECPGLCSRERRVRSTGDAELTLHAKCACMPPHRPTMHCPVAAADLYFAFCVFCRQP